MGDHMDKINEQWALVVEEYKKAVEDGVFSAKDLFSLVVVGLGGAIRLVKPYVDLPYHEKKRVASELAKEFVEEVVNPIDIPMVPNIIEPFFDKQLANIAPVLVEALYDALYEFIYKTDDVVVKAMNNDN